MGSYQSPQPAPMDSPLPAPWDAASRTWALHRLLHGEPLGVPPGVQEAARGAGALLLERAVMPAGFTGGEALGAFGKDALGLPQGLARTVVMLTHGGPRTTDSQPGRPVAFAQVLDPITGRTPRALTPEEWTAVHNAFVAAAKEAVDAGAWALGLEMARGHLLHSALSPLLHGSVTQGLEKALPLVTALSKLHARVVVSLPVEDVAVGGLHAGDGITLAKAVVEAGAGLLVGRTGSAHFPARLLPPEPRMPEEEGASLQACAWLKGALPNVCVMAAGGIRTARVAGMAVGRHMCDGVVVGRPLREGKLLVP